MAIFRSKATHSEFIIMISIRKGQALTIPILALNRAKWIWGEDAAEFRLVVGPCIH